MKVLGAEELDLLWKRDVLEERKLRIQFNANIDYARANCVLKGATPASDLNNKSKVLTQEK